MKEFLPLTDCVRPFGLEGRAIMGHAVCLEGVLDRLLNQHRYPEAVNLLLAKLISLSALLYGTIKTPGRLTLQIEAEGAIKTMVCDISSCGDARAYARFDRDAQFFQGENFDDSAFHDLLKNGHLMVVIEPPYSHQRYQEIVALKRFGIEESFTHYLTQSVQLKATVQLFTVFIDHQDFPFNGYGSSASRRSWGVMLQQQESAVHAADEDCFESIECILKTVSAQEIAKPSFSSDGLIYKLFHEYGVRVYPSLSLQAKCQCSQEKVDQMAKQWKEMFDQPSCPVTCEFCGQTYIVNQSRSFLQ